MMKFKNIENKYDAINMFAFMVKMIVLGIIGLITNIAYNNVIEIISGIVIIGMILNWNRISYLIICAVTTEEERNELLSYEEREL